LVDSVVFFAVLAGVGFVDPPSEEDVVPEPAEVDSLEALVEAPSVVEAPFGFFSRLSVR
jgi:hypothetical protein